MKKRLHLLLLLLIDLAMVAMEAPIVLDEWRSNGVWMLRFYTQSSNVLAMFVCVICAACEIGCLVKKRALPHWAQLLRYIAACCLIVTMVVSACILVPMNPAESLRGFMLEGVLLYVHTLCPLVMLVGFLLSGGAQIKLLHALIALIPTIVYGIITLVMNARRVYTGPYFFFEIYRQTWTQTVMWLSIVVGGNFALAWGLGCVKNGISAKVTNRL